jgi:hypothetical protein
MKTKNAYWQSPKAFSFSNFTTSKLTLYGDLLIIT